MMKTCRIDGVKLDRPRKSQVFRRSDSNITRTGSFKAATIRKVEIVNWLRGSRIVRSGIDVLVQTPLNFP